MDGQSDCGYLNRENIIKFCIMILCPEDFMFPRGTQCRRGFELPYIDTGTD